MQEQSTENGFVLTVEEVVATDAATFEKVLRQPWSIAQWHDLTLKPSMRPHEPQDVGSHLEFVVRVGPLFFDYVMITSGREPGKSLSQRTTKGFVNVEVAYTWEPRPDGLLVRVVSTYRFPGPLWWKVEATRKVARKELTQASRKMREMFDDPTWRCPQ